MKFVDHKDMSPEQLAKAKSYAKLLAQLGPDINKVLHKHGLSQMYIESFALKERTQNISASANEPYPTELGVTVEGHWVAVS